MSEPLSLETFALGSIAAASTLKFVRRRVFEHVYLWAYCEACYEHFHTMAQRASCVPLRLKATLRFATKLKRTRNTLENCAVFVVIVAFRIVCCTADNCMRKFYFSCLCFFFSIIHFFCAEKYSKETFASFFLPLRVYYFFFWLLHLCSPLRASIQFNVDGLSRSVRRLQWKCARAKKFVSDCKAIF